MTVAGAAAGGFVPPLLTYFVVEQHMGFAVPMLIGRVGGLISFVITLFFSLKQKAKRWWPILASLRSRSPVRLVALVS